MRKFFLALCALLVAVPAALAQDINGGGLNNSLAGAGGGAVTSVGNADGSLTISPTVGAVVASLNPAHATTWAAVQTFPANDLVLSGVTGSTQCLQASTTGVVTGTGAACGGAGVTSVTAGNTSLTISPTTGAVVASLNLANANTWTAVQTFNNGFLSMAGATSGNTLLEATAAAGAGTVATFPANTGTVAELNLAQTWSAAQTFGASDIVLTGATGCVTATAGVLSGTGSACGGTGGTPAGPTTAVQFNNSGAFGGDSGFTYAGTGSATLALGTITTNKVGLSLTGTWNAAVTFDAPIVTNITNTLSNGGTASTGAGSLLQDWQIAGASVAGVSASDAISGNSNGSLFFGVSGAGANYGAVGHQTNTTWLAESRGGVEAILTLTSGGNTITSGAGTAFNVTTGATNAGLLFSANGNPLGSGVAVQTSIVWSGRNSFPNYLDFNAATNPVGLRVYSTDDSSLTFPAANYTRGIFDMIANSPSLTIGTQSGGTGAVGNVNFISSQTGTASLYTFFTANSGASWLETISINGSAPIVTMPNTSLIGFASTTGAAAPSTTPDTAIARNAAGVLEIDNGTAGTFRDLSLRHLRGNGAPTANVCTGFALATGGSDLAGTVTFTSGTSCSITFASAFTNAPACVISPGSALSTTEAVATTAGLTATFGTAQTAFSYHCIGL